MQISHLGTIKIQISFKFLKKMLFRLSTADNFKIQFFSGLSVLIHAYLLKVTCQIIVEWVFIGLLSLTKYIQENWNIDNFPQLISTMKIICWFGKQLHIAGNRRVEFKRNGNYTRVRKLGSGFTMFNLCSILKVIRANEKSC